MKFSRSAPAHIMNHELVLNTFEAKFILMPERLRDLNQNMFREDFGHIFISLNRRNTDLFVINSNNEEVQQEISNSFIRAFDHCYDETVFQKVLEEIIQNLSHFGKAAYSLQAYQSDEKTFRLLMPSTIFKRFGLLFQYLPKRIVQNWGKDDVQHGREVRLLNAHQVLFFEWPKSVLKKIKAQNQILEVLDKYAYAGASEHIAIPTHKNPYPKNNFDFSVWRNARDEALFEATKHTGWSGRQGSSSKSDFFICYRMLRFRRLQVETCIYLLDELSRQLTTIGKLSVPDFEIQILFNEDFPSLSEIDRLETQLLREEIDFDQVLNFCSNRE